MKSSSLIPVSVEKGRIKTNNEIVISSNIGGHSDSFVLGCGLGSIDT